MMFCSRCGTELNEGAAFCSKCGVRVAPVLDQPADDISPKSRLATTLLAWFLGVFGAHRFYMGKTGTAVIMLILGILSGACYFVGFFGGLAAERGEPVWGLMLIAGVLYLPLWVWTIIDFVIAVTGNFKDRQGRPIRKW